MFIIVIGVSALIANVLHPSNRYYNVSEKELAVILIKTSVEVTFIW
jgi:hypothetical protein